MIPLCDVIPSRTRPVVTFALIAAMAGAFAFELALPGSSRQALLRDYGVRPGHVSVMSPVTSLFLHGGWVQLVGNLWFLWLFGPNVEDRFGRRRFLAFYLLAGVAAVLAQAQAAPDWPVPIAGANGAIAGVLGAYVVLYPRSLILTLIPMVVFVEIVEMPALWFLACWFLLQLFGGVGAIAYTATAYGAISFWSQVTGFAAGFAGAFVLRRPRVWEG